MRREIAFSTLNLRGWFHRLCIRAAIIVLMLALVGVGLTFSIVSGFYFWDSFATICASEDSRSLMGGSDVVHCVQVPLAGTTGAWLLSVREDG